MAKQIVIGLDFGTTYRSDSMFLTEWSVIDLYSAVAYCDNQGDIENASAGKLITEWPGPRSSNDKVPSRISYGPPPKVEIKWGNLIKFNDKAKPHALMKLKLDERLKKSKQLRLLLQFLAAGMGGLSLEDVDSDDEDDGPPEYPGKSPVEIVTDYLSQIRAHAWTEMEKTYGKALLDSLEKVLVVTVPAVWSERAKDQTLKAVQNSNWGSAKILMVTEPEAAAVYTLKYMSQGVNKDQISVGDNFVLCDAGGGTVDLISYKVTKITPRFGIEEAVVGSGDKCGATYVDREFLTWLKSWIGEQAYNKIPSRLMDEFEMNKNNFRGEEEDTMDIQLPRECGIEEDEGKNISDYALSVTG
jgi:molecular chaperone DnaK (HSP70)